MKTIYHLLAVVFCLGANASHGKVSVGKVTSLNAPLSHQVVQRGPDNLGTIRIVGSFTGNADGFQVSSSNSPGFTGNPISAWTPLQNPLMVFNPNGNNLFSGLYQLPAGGFYDLKIRAVKQGVAGATYTFKFVGVGEVFITAGQSNSTAFGAPTGLVPDPRVWAYNPFRKNWQLGRDPLPEFDLSSGGSVWPQMASNLANALNMPIGLYSVGYGGTSVEQWIPNPASVGAVDPGFSLFQNLQVAIEYLTYFGGVRAVLWDQGETDFAYKTPVAFYQANLQNLMLSTRATSLQAIAAIENDPNQPFSIAPLKWMGAQVACVNNDPDCVAPGFTQNQIQTYMNNLISAESAAINTVNGLVGEKFAYVGPYTDSIPASYRLPSAFVHFNAAGLALLGNLWGIFIYNLSPGFLS